MLKFGGFPQPFIQRNDKFSDRWRKLRTQQLFYEDIRDLSRIQDISQLVILSKLISHQTGQLVNYSNLSNKVRVSVDTVHNWINTLSAFYYCFTIQPWSKNISRSLLKQPKIYLWDWSEVEDPGARYENFIASHLLKAVHFWSDCGFGSYELYFLRDKEKNEVDFLVTKNNKPWFIVEVKSSSKKPPNHSLSFFQNQINAPHAFQVVFDMEYVQQDCFQYHQPVIVPAQTLLSQLI